MSLSVSLLGLVLVASMSSAETVIVPVVADTSICAHSSERELNAGGAARIKLKGTENLILLDFYPEVIRWRRIRSAVLKLKEAEPGPMVRRIGISTVSTGWVEGTGSYEPGDGATFLRRGPGKGAYWAGPGSTFLDAVFGRAGSIWTRTIASRGADGVWTIPVDPRMLEAHAANISAGLAISDDSGQTMGVSREVDPASNMSNNWFWSREQSGRGPVLEVELGEACPPGSEAEPARLDVWVAPWPGGPGSAGGGIEVGWAGPATATEYMETLGYRIWFTIGAGRAELLPRWMYPTVPPPGGTARIQVPNLPAGVSIIAEVEVVGRACRSLARGQGGGFASSVPEMPGPMRIRAASPGRATRAPAAAGTSAVWAIPDGTKVNPVTGNALEEPGVDYAGPAAGNWRSANPAWDGARRAVPLAAIRGEWVAFQLVVEYRGEGTADWRVVPRDLKGPGGSVIPARAVRLSLARYLRVGKAWYADPLVPLKAGDTFHIPADVRVLPEQVNQMVYAEILVPASAKPGRYRGTVDVVPGKGKPVPVVVDLEVGAGVMPREAHFTWSMNAYSSPGPGAERAYYAMAHDHRTNLAILHYSHSGNYELGCVPAVKGRGASARVADWTAWDARFGPLFDGSAFAGTSRAGIGLDHFYLALSEHYPVPMGEGYRWNSLRWEDHWREAGTVGEGFTPEMQATWVAVAKDYIAHIRAKGWKTQFQVYLNDKYYYKMYDAKRKAWGKGVSFWLLDEPVHPDDFLALAFFGNLLREAQAGDRSRVAFRVDVSQPHWGRDILDRVVDVNVTGGWPNHRALLEGWKALHGQRYWTYGDTPPATQSALAISAQALSLWASGVDGYVPWLVLGEDRNWTDAASTSVIYPGKPAGIDGPCASLRLKAYRRAEQDVEYAWAYAQKRGWLADDPFRRRVAALLGDALRFTRTFGFLDSEGAVTESISGVTPESLESLRAALRAGL